MNNFKLLFLLSLFNSDIFGSVAVLTNGLRGAAARSYRSGSLPSNIRSLRPQKSVNFSMHSPQQSTLKETLEHSAKASEEVADALKETDKHLAELAASKSAVTFENFSREKLKFVGKKMQILDTEFLPRYASGAVGGLTSGAVFYGLNKSNSDRAKQSAKEQEETIKSAAQTIHGIEHELRTNSNKYSVQELQDLELNLHDLKIDFIKKYNSIILEKELQDLEKIQQLEQKKLSLVNPQVSVWHRNTLNTKPPVDDKNSMQQGWLDWGLSGLYTLPSALYNRLYTGAAYVLSPLADSKTSALNNHNT